MGSAQGDGYSAWADAGDGVSAVLWFACAGAAAVALGGMALSVRLDRKHRRLRERLKRVDARLRGVEADSLRWRKRVAASEARARLGEAGREARLELAFRSQYGEDVLLWELFDGAMEGRFVEAGAYDGKTLSVTWALEAVGWRGLLVEPIAARAEACRGARSGSYVVRAALGPEAGGEVTLRVVEGGGAGIDMLSHVEGLVSAEERAAAVARQRRAGTAERVREERAPMTTLDAALAEAETALGVTMAGLEAVVLDIEGAEAAALRGLDLSRWRPRVFVIEDNTLGREREASGLLRAGGYEEMLRVGVNRVFIRADDGALMARAREMAAGVDWPNVTPVGL